MILCLPNVFYWRTGPAAFMLSTQSKHINKPYAVEHVPILDPGLTSASLVL